MLDCIVNRCDAEAFSEDNDNIEFLRDLARVFYRKRDTCKMTAEFRNKPLMARDYQVKSRRE
jgi:hypothetical protein